MTIVAGMILLCAVKIGAPGMYGSFLKDTPTKVLYVFEDKKNVLVEYDFSKAPGIRYIGDRHDEKPTEKVGIVDLFTKTYMDCKESK